MATATRSLSTASLIPPTLSRSLHSSRTPSLAPRPLSRLHFLRSQSQRRTLYGYTQAKSLLYTRHGEPKDVLDIHTHSLSPPHSNLLTLKTLSAPVNPADINQIQGLYASLPPFTSSLGTSTPSAVPGNEAVFEVTSTGSSVSTVKKGDWVIPSHTGLGTWRTALQVPERDVLRVEKEGLEAKDVAQVSVNPVTAWRLLVDFVDVKRGGGGGEWVLQNGANSGVGRGVLQLAREWGIKVIAVVRDRPGEEGTKLRRELEELGAAKVVSEEEALSKDFKAQVREWTGDKMPRLALNCVGGKPALALAKVLSDGGTMVTYGAMSKQPLSIPAGMLIFRNVRFEGFWVSKWADANKGEKRRVVDEVLGMVREGRYKMGPTVEVEWGGKTKKEEIVEAVQGALEGYRKGKGVFVFKE